MNRLFSWGGLAAVLVGVVVATVALDKVRAPRWDLTERGLYTVSDATRQLLADLPAAVTLTLHFNAAAAEGTPALLNHAAWAGELLDVFAEASGGKVTVERADPAPFSEAEDAALAAGLQGVPLGNGDSLYLGIVGRGVDGRTASLPFLLPDRETLLEYELARLVVELSRTAAPRIGLASGLPVAGGYDFATGRPRPAWTTVRELRELFDVRDVDLADPAALDGLDLLVVIHPAALDEAARYALDQYALSGRRLVMFVDPHADQADGGSALMATGSAAPPGSVVPDLLAAWGVQVDPERVVADPDHALVVSGGDNSAPLRMLTMFAVEAGGRAAGSPLVSGNGAVHFSSAGAITVLDAATTTVETLLATGPETGTVAAATLAGGAMPAAIAGAFVAGTGPAAVAVRISGPARSAFADGRPGGATDAADPADAATAGSAGADADAPGPAAGGGSASDAADAGAGDGSGDEPGDEPADGPDPHRADGTVDIVLFADTDLLADPLWVSVRSFFGQSIAEPFADNGNLVLNLVEHAAGAPALLAIRSRETWARPFERVLALRREAEDRLLAKERELQARLQETEQRLVELEQAREGDGAGLTAEQQQALADFQARKLAIRRDLRAVNRELSESIDTLGTQVKFANTFGVALLLGLLALVQAARRMLRRG